MGLRPVSRSNRRRADDVPFCARTLLRSVTRNHQCVCPASSFPAYESHANRSGYSVGDATPTTSDCSRRASVSLMTAWR
jgi:hypothetical protein